MYIMLHKVFSFSFSPLQLERLTDWWLNFNENKDDSFIKNIYFQLWLVKKKVKHETLESTVHGTWKESENDSVSLLMAK